MEDNRRITAEEFRAFEEFLGGLQMHKVYSIHAAKLAAVSDYHADRMEKILGCGRYVALQPRAETAGGGWEIVASNFCRLRMCPMCAWRRSLRLYAHMLRVRDALPGYEWVLMTLTVPNVAGDALADMITRLHTASRELLKLPELRGFKGWLRCTEVTYSPERRDYHPHLHILAAVRPGYFKGKQYIKQATLQALWQRWFPDVQDTDIRKVRGYKGVCEVCKYAVKPLICPEDDDMRAEQARALDTLWSALHGRRLLQSAGVIRDALRRLKIDLEDDGTESTEDAERPLWRLTWYDDDMAYHPCKER
jgi:hypothetical protein